MVSQFWNDCGGAVPSSEVVVLGTIIAIGLIVGMSEFHDAVINEINDVGESVGSLNQGFSIHGQSKRQRRVRQASTAGATFLDRQDDCDGNECAISCSPPERELPK